MGQIVNDRRKICGNINKLPKRFLILGILIVLELHTTKSLYSIETNIFMLYDNEHILKIVFAGRCVCIDSK